METRTFILFRNKKYADFVATKLSGIIRNSEEILCIRPIENDVFLIDTHFGGQMSHLNGLDIVNKLLKDRKGVNFKIKVFSWFSIETISQIYPEKATCLNKSNIQFIRYPVIIS